MRINCKYTHILIFSKLVFFLFFLFVILPVCSGNESEFDFGFIATRDTDLTGNERFRSIGPFIEKQISLNGKTFKAVRPFFNSVTDESRGHSIKEFLWPLGMLKDYNDETYWRFINVFGHDFDNTKPKSRYRFVAFPFVFAGRDKNDEKYFAVFPIGGKINEMLGRDKIIFLLFPLYSFSSINDVRSVNILWPFISWTKGTHVDRLRIFPFYGKSVNKGRWTKKFIVWPIWTSAQYNYAETYGKGFILFPLFGHIKLNDQETWMALPPLFRWSGGKNYKVLNCPWPILQYSSGKIDKFYIWPLWGTKKSLREKSSFLLWPFISLLEMDRNDYILKRFSFFPLISYESRTVKVDKSMNNSSNTNILKNEKLTGVGIKKNEKYFKLWPLLSYKRKGNTLQTRILALWPTKHLASVEKNFASFWTLYSHTRIDGAKEDELLWGLFRYRRERQGNRKISIFPVFSSRKLYNNDDCLKEWSFLMGLAGYKRKGLQKTYRLLYFIKLKKGEDVQ